MNYYYFIICCIDYYTEVVSHIRAPWKVWRLWWTSLTNDWKSQLNWRGALVLGACLCDNRHPLRFLDDRIGLVSWRICFWGLSGVGVVSKSLGKTTLASSILLHTRAVSTKAWVVTSTTGHICNMHSARVLWGELGWTRRCQGKCHHLHQKWEAAYTLRKTEPMWQSLAD